MASHKQKEKWGRGGRPQIQQRLESKEIEQKAKNMKHQRWYRLNCLQSDMIRKQMETSFVQLEPPMDECEQQKVASNCANFVCK
jgi:hypothetical protein